MTERRYLHAAITRDLAAKMVFVGGPRQVGKTTLCRDLLTEQVQGIYLSWDRVADRRVIRNAEWPSGKAVVVLDEFHKQRGWKRWIKGEHDRFGDRIRFLVTGSARLDVFRRGGDSLQGRYHHYRLHPFSCAEIAGRDMAVLPSPGRPLDIPAANAHDTFESLLRLGGFPEPFLAGSERVLRRWHKERLERFFREDVRDLELLRDYGGIQTLADLLPERVGSPLSLNALREDLEVSHRAVTHWVDVLDRLYFLFRVRPFATRMAQSLRKMPKAFLWDWSVVTEPGPRFENLVASHLLKFCHGLEDVEGFRMELCYLRDVTGREVDFLVTCNRKPWFAVECKLSDQSIDPSLTYYRDRLKIPWVYQVVCHGERDFEVDGVRCLPAHRFLAALA